MKHFAMILMASIAISGCQTTLMLQQHRKELRKLASESTPPEQAFTGLAAVITTVFDEVLALDNPDQQVNFLRKFSKQNDEEISIIFKRLNDWKAGLRPLEKVQATTRLARDPNVKRLVTQLPAILQLINGQEGELGKVRQLLLLYRVRQWIRQ